MTEDTELKLVAAFELQQKGRLEDAEKGFLNVLSSDATNIHALNLLGINYMARERLEDAVGLLRKAAEIAPNDAETLNSFGLALARSGRSREAVSQFQTAVSVGGPNPGVLGNLGAALIECGRAEEAMTPLSQALRVSQPTSDLLANLAKALSALGRYEEARPAAEQAVRLQPAAPEIQNILGEILLKQGRLSEARECFSKSLEVEPRQIEAMVNLATTWKEEGEIERCVELLNKLAKDYPGSPEPHFDLGVLAEQLGNAEEALSHFERAIAFDPDFAKAYYQAAQLKGVALPASLRAAIEAQLDNKTHYDNDRKLLHFALATMLEKEGDYAASIAQFRLAHDGVRDTYDPQATERMHARQKIVFSMDGPAALRNETNTRPRPLFVLGMPRSGTSLVEQILSAHPEIKGAGESSILTDCSNEAARLARKPFPECIAALSSDQRWDLGRRYRNRLMDGRGDTSWIIDKTPLNFQLIGFARAILPEARFIHCRRDPLNTCLSIYKIPFDQNQNYAASFASLGHFYGAYRELMRHWQSILGDQLQSIDYEALVDDSERETRSLLDWLGLQFDPAVLRFYEQRRLVRTPSATQVSQPVYRSSVSLAERYGEELNELRGALAGCYG